MQMDVESGIGQSELLQVADAVAREFLALGLEGSPAPSG